MNNSHSGAPMPCARSASRRLPPTLTYDRKLVAYHLDLTEKELSALSHGSDIDWGDCGREIERHDDDRVKVYWGIAETW
jgi:hypothetical protein